jgi:hypothetical protein
MQNSRLRLLLPGCPNHLSPGVFFCRTKISAWLLFKYKLEIPVKLLESVSSNRPGSLYLRTSFRDDSELMLQAVNQELIINLFAKIPVENRMAAGSVTVSRGYPQNPVLLYFSFMFSKSRTSRPTTSAANYP